MDLRTRVARAALRRPGVLLAVCPGATRARLAAEAELARRGWPAADGPADADVLVVLGDPDPAGAGWLVGLWDAMPAPRGRVVVREAAGVPAALDRVRDGLFGGAADGGEEPLWRAAGALRHDHEATEHAHEAANGEPAHGAEAEHDAHDAHDAANGHGAHHAHGPMQVAGRPMADRADDRDGLRLDRLHVPLGPVLPAWPAGLVLRLALQGDVVQRAEVEQVPVRSAAVPYWDEPWLRAVRGERVPRGEAERRRCAAHLDSLARFLAVAGWDDAAVRARLARDGALAGDSPDRLRASVRAATRRVERSRVLRWLTAGLGVLDAGGTDLPPAAGGDVHDRVCAWCTRARQAAAAACDPEPLPDDAYGAYDGPRGRLDGAAPPSRALLDVLPDLLAGTELAGARLILASLDPDPDQTARMAKAAPAHG